MGCNARKTKQNNKDSGSGGIVAQVVEVLRYKPEGREAIRIFH
jgi:hypothetical protein